MTNAFDELQKKLIPMWQLIGHSTPGGPARADNSSVVVPSLPDVPGYTPGSLASYEERMLFLLFLLRQPNIRLIFVTSKPVQPEIIDYYLELIPGIVSSSARDRLALVSPQDGTARPLAEKLLKRPALLEHIRSLIPDFDRAHMIPFVTTDDERELAVQLGIPMYAADPRYFAFGTKSGGRQLFAEEGVQHPLGYENLQSVDDVIAAMEQIRAAKPSVQRLILKLNAGVSGAGNAVVDLSDSLSASLRNMRLESPKMTYDHFVLELESGGAVIEEFVGGEEVRSPSAQLRITPLGEVEGLSTHDQLLGGPSGQSYLGAKFPADPAYSGLIMREAIKVGERLAKEGIVGRFAIDFVATRQPDGSWEAYAIEINLRKGGTTAPFLILQYLTDGHFNADAGTFITAQGNPKYYVSSDHVEAERYRVFTPESLFDIVSRHRLHFDHASQTGVVLQMITGIGELGRVGATAIHNSPDEAEALYNRFVQTLDDEAAARGKA